jgi:hypothetical protein
MNTFIYGWLTTLFVLIHLRLVGNVQYRTEYTNNDYRRTYVIQSVECKETIVIYCREIKHSVNFKSWLLSKRYYTYEVTVEQLTDTGVIKDTSTAIYPRFGVNILRRSKYPHTRAINAHLDVIQTATQISSP